MTDTPHGPRPSQRLVCFCKTGDCRLDLGSFLFPEERLSGHTEWQLGPLGPSSVPQSGGCQKRTVCPLGVRLGALWPPRCEEEVAIPVFHGVREGRQPQRAAGL